MKRNPAPVSAQRSSDWPERLTAYLAADRETPFQWGVFDCALFACGAAYCITGVDLAAPLRGRYKTVRGAVRVLKSFAGGGLDAAAEKIAAAHGIDEVPVGLAQRGDIALVEMAPAERVPTERVEDIDAPGAGIRHALTVVMIGHLVGAGPNGVERLPLRRARRVWAVGRPAPRLAGAKMGRDA